MPLVFFVPEDFVSTEGVVVEKTAECGQDLWSESLHSPAGFGSCFQLITY